MSDWEEDADDSRSTPQNVYNPPSGRGWHNSYVENVEENFSDGRRPGFGRGRANRFGNAREEYSSLGKRNDYSERGSFRGFSGGESGFGGKQFARGGRSWRGSREDDGWQDRRNRDYSRGNERERNSTEIMVPSDDVRYIIGKEMKCGLILYFSSLYLQRHIHL